MPFLNLLLFQAIPFILTDCTHKSKMCYFEIWSMRAVKNLMLVVFTILITRKTSKTNCTKINERKGKRSMRQWIDVEAGTKCDCSIDSLHSTDRH